MYFQKCLLCQGAATIFSKLFFTSYSQIIFLSLIDRGCSHTLAIASVQTPNYQLRDHVLIRVHLILNSLLNKPILKISSAPSNSFLIAIIIIILPLFIKI